MNVQELRIGNYLNYTDEPDALYCEVNEICPAGAVIFPIYKSDLGDTVAVTSEKLQPIPITEQWLKDFGFNEAFQFQDNEYFSLNRLHSNNELWGLYFEEEYTATDIKYVHQLQNLYFSLVGTELIVQP